MTRLALISDIHGNCVALDAVIGDLAHRRVDEIVCLGDIAAGGPQPQAVIARLRELDCRSVRGNADAWLLDGVPPGRSNETRRLGENVSWARTVLSRDDLEYLAGLPPTLTVETDGVILLCFHGSPRSDVERLLATTPDDELDLALGKRPEWRLGAGGHTHLQLLRTRGDRVLVNPGSVGLPLGALDMSEPPLPTHAEYALVDVSGSQVEIAFRRIPVDLDALAGATTAMPNASWAADLQRRIRRWNERPAATASTE
jgi:predicted phosphodiesterase